MEQKKEEKKPVPSVFVDVSKQSTAEILDKTYELVLKHDAQSIVLHCGDPRFQKAFRAFLKDRFGYDDGDYIPIIVSGSIGTLAEGVSFVKEAKAIKDNISIYIDRFKSIKHIILINHEDCGKYKEIQNRLTRSFLARFSSIIDHQKFDLKVAMKVLKELNPNMPEIKMFYAKFTDDNHTYIKFDEIT